MSELRDSSQGTMSEANVSAFSRREEEQPRDRRADRRKAAHGDELARIATRLGGAYFRLRKMGTSYSNTLRKSARW